MNRNNSLEPCASGREYIPDYNGGVPFELFRENFSNKNKEYKDSIRGIHEKNDLNTRFFSQKNVDLIQQLIQAQVRKQSKGKFQIGKQSEEQLVIIMRSIYLQQGKNLPDNIQEQIDELNKKIVEECVRIVMVNIKSYIGYIKDVNAPPSFISRPTSTSVKNNTLMNNIGFKKYQN